MVATASPHSSDLIQFKAGTAGESTPGCVGFFNRQGIFHKLPYARV